MPWNLLLQCGREIINSNQSVKQTCERSMKVCLRLVQMVLMMLPNSNRVSLLGSHSRDHDNLWTCEPWLLWSLQRFFRWLLPPKNSNFRHTNLLGIKLWSKHFGSKSSKWSKHREPRTTSTLRVQSWRQRMEMKVEAKVVQSFNFEENQKWILELFDESKFCTFCFLIGKLRLQFRKIWFED